MMTRIPTEIELRRLGNGWLADACPMPRTLDDAKEVLEIVYDGIRALQSTDDLGHPVITEKGAKLHDRLHAKAIKIEKLIKKFVNARVAKLAAAPRSKRGAERRGGSTPLPGTKI